MNLHISEIFTSIQGESTYAGRPCQFIRLAGCQLNCRYCDTRYARILRNSSSMSTDALLEGCISKKTRLVCVTGGEPLLQEPVYDFMKRLLNHGFTVLLETNGAVSIEKVPPGVVRILDCKCPSSGESGKMNFANYPLLTPEDQVKFVMGSRRDYAYSLEISRKFSLFNKKITVLLSPNMKKISPATLAKWILKDEIPAVMNIQLQKIIWPEIGRGV